MFLFLALLITASLYSPYVAVKGRFRCLLGTAEAQFESRIAQNSSHVILGGEEKNQNSALKEEGSCRCLPVVIVCVCSSIPEYELVHGAIPAVAAVVLGVRERKILADYWIPINSTGKSATVAKVFFQRILNWSQYLLSKTLENFGNAYVPIFVFIQCCKNFLGIFQVHLSRCTKSPSLDCN